MPDMQKVLQTKERIMEVVRKNGPELPIRVAQTINTSHLFVAAFMSELVNEQRLKLSNMRVGSSPLYYIEGQEEQLQKYVEHLNHKEKEAFRLLKQKQILEDSEQEPAIRVALRSIKDFAVPIQVRTDTETKTFWKIHTFANEEVKKLIEQKINSKNEVKKEQIISTNNSPLISTPVNEIPEKVNELVNKELEVGNISTIIKKELTKKENEEQKIIETKKEITTVVKQSTDFTQNVHTYLEGKIGEIIEEILVKKKEFVFKIKMNIPLGKQEYYVIAKDKKKITVDDLSIGVEKSKSEKMPVIILATGEIDKKAKEYLKEWRNLIKFEKI